MDGLRWFLLLFGLIVVVGVYFYTRRERQQQERERNRENSLNQVGPRHRQEAAHQRVQCHHRCADQHSG